MGIKLIPTLLLFLLALPVCISQLEQLEGILAITPGSFDDDIKENENLFLMFHKQEKLEDLEPFSIMFREFKKAYKEMKNREWPVAFGVVDSANYGSIAERCGITEFPIFRLFINGSPVTYKGGNTAEDILYFLEIKMQPVSVEFYIPEDIEHFIANKEALVYFGEAKKDNPKFQQFLSMARNYDDVLFAHCGMYECIEYYKIGWDNMIFFKKQNNLSYDLKDPWTDYFIKRLIEDHYTKVLTYFDELVADYIFTRNNVGLFLFRDKSNPSHIKYEIMAKRVAKFFKGFIHFIIVDIKDKFEQELAKATKIRAKDLPCIFIHDARMENIFTYKMEGDIYEQNIYNFALDFGQTKLQPFYASEDPLPLDKQTFPVMTLVGKTFQSLVLDDQENEILLYVSSDDCKHCPKAKLLFEKFAIVASEKNKKIKFLQMNLDYNEIPDLEVVGLPNIKLFPLGARKNYIDYPITEDRSLKRIAEFLTRNIKDFDMTGINNQLDEEFEREYENLMIKTEEYSERIKDEI